jgi:hypothetical protein
MTYEQFIAGREHDVIPEREVWDAAQAAERKRIMDWLAYCAEQHDGDYRAD